MCYLCDFFQCVAEFAQRYSKYAMGVWMCFLICFALWGAMAMGLFFGYTYKVNQDLHFKRPRGFRRDGLLDDYPDIEEFDEDDDEYSVVNASIANESTIEYNITKFNAEDQFRQLKLLQKLITEMGNDYSTLPVTTFGKKTVSLPDNSISQDFKTTNTITELEQLRKETQTRVVTITAGLTTTVSDKTGKFNNSAVNKEIQEHNATTVANDNINILIEKESRTKPFENTEDIRKFEFKAQLEPSYDDETLNETARLLEQLKFIEEEVNKLPEESTAETLLTSEADEYELEPDSLPSPLPDVSGQDTMLTNTIKTEKAHQEERDYTIIQRFKPIDVFSGTKMVPLQRKGYTRVPVNTVGHKRVTVRTTARLVPGRTRGYSRPTRSTSNVM